MWNSIYLELQLNLTFSVSKSKDILIFQTFLEARWSGLGDPEESLSFRQFLDWNKVILLVGFVWTNTSSNSLNTRPESTYLISIPLSYRSLGILHLFSQEAEIFSFPCLGQCLHWYKALLPAVTVECESCHYAFLFLRWQGHHGAISLSHSGAPYLHPRHSNQRSWTPRYSYPKKVLKLTILEYHFASS